MSTLTVYVYTLSHVSPTAHGLTSQPESKSFVPFWPSPIRNFLVTEMCWLTIVDCRPSLKCWMRLELLKVFQSSLKVWKTG